MLTVLCLLSKGSTSKERLVSKMNKRNKRKVSGKKIVIYTIVFVVFLAFACLAVYLKNVSDYKQAVKSIAFGEIDVSEAADGVYIGECNVNFIYAKVEVTVHAGKIENINILEHKNESGESAEVVVDKIVEEQRIDVDEVSGATNSSIVLKKAVENALEQAYAAR
ncbi:uncharacterized protein with FMN-binding domain [Kineothrix alysoides]|uniref:Uncharacterized protein with FMN-binding domain n=2 Tax=Kineothrix alysoides TaxID=1469948 RepID=A0A4R1QWG7_9FIRM|nr:uncharacterized protein with FMN-binding domain [Kineothrix alysoides]